MSDAPQGEGWWLASDGRWYPPSATPAAAEPPPAPGAPGDEPAAPGAVDGGGAPPPVAEAPATSGPPPAGDAASGPPASGPPPSAPAAGATAGSSGGGSAGKGVLLLVVGLVVGLLIGGGVAWAVAGSGDDGTDWGPFCDRAVELEEEYGDDEAPEEEQAALIAELLELAPEEYREKLEPLQDLAGEGGEVDDLDAFGDILGTAMYFAGLLEVECGIESDDSFGGGFEGSFSTGGEGDPFEEDPFGDDPFDEGSEDEDDDPMSLDAIQAWAEENHGDEAWFDAITSWGVVSGSSLSVSPFGEDLPAADALAACEALAEYVFDQVPDGDVTVNDADGEPVVEASGGAACVAVG